MFVLDDIIKAIGAHQAAKAQERSVREAMGLQRDIYGQSRDDQQPWMQAGQTSLADMMKMMGPGYDSSQLANDPGYQFRMAEGQKAMERSAAARGGLASGGFAKGLARYSQGVASDEFGNRFSRLAGISGMGQGSAQSLAGLGRGYADSMSSLYGAQGNARAAGKTAVYGGIANSLGSAVNLGMLAAGNPMPMMGSMAGGGGGGIPTQASTGSMRAGGGSGAGWGQNSYWPSGGGAGGPMGDWNPYGNGYA